MKKPSQNSKLFAKKEQITRGELRQYLKEDSGVVPRAMVGKYRRRERVAFERNIFPWGKYGKEISQQDFRRAVRKLRGQRCRISAEKEKIEIEKKIRYLKKIAGL